MRMIRMTGKTNFKTHMRMIRMTGRTKEVTKKPTWKPVRLYPARSKAQITELPEDQK